MKLVTIKYRKEIQIHIQTLFTRKTLLNFTIKTYAIPVLNQVVKY